MLLPSGWNGSALAAAAPPVWFTNSSCSGSRNANFVLRAWPGDFLVQSTTNLAADWSNETEVSVGSIGDGSGVIPLLGRSPLFLRARGRTPSDGAGCLAQFTTLGSSFEPEVGCAGEPSEFLWLWSDGTTSTNRPLATKVFGSEEPRVQGLKLDPASSLISINLGFDGADGGDTTPLTYRPSQLVSAVRIPFPLPNLRWWASSYNPIMSTLDFSGCANLEAIECYNCAPLRHVVVTNLPALRRVCFEDCDLLELDLSGNPNLGDVRGALNAFTNIVTGRGTGPNIWHWCTRDNPQLTQRFADIMTNFLSLRELYIWNDNQHGHFTTGSTNLTDALLYDNHYTSADFTGQRHLRQCLAFVNDLTNVFITGCTGLEEVNFAYNQLTTAALDHILTELDQSAPLVRTVNLSHNPQFPTSAGYTHCSNLVNRGVLVTVDWNVNTNVFSGGIPGGTNAITFVTVNRTTRMEIRTSSTPTHIIWRWGDGSTNTGATVVSHDFQNTGIFTNYVEVIPASCVTYFGSASGSTGQGIRGVFGATNFPNLNFLFLYQENLMDLSIAGCGNLVQLHLADNPVSTQVCDQWFLDLDAAVAGPVTGADFYYPSGHRSTASDAAAVSLSKKGYNLHPPVSITIPNDGTNDIPVFTNAVTFVTASRQPHMQIRTTSTPTTIVWHWGDGTITTGASLAQHDFGTAGLFTNYVEVTPPECVGYFGAQGTQQGITGVGGLTNFSNLTFLYLYDESVTDLSLAGCSKLVQLHLAANPVSVRVCDQWFIDLDAAVTGPVTGADFYYPHTQRSAASDAAWTSLQNKGYNLIPF